MWRGRSIDNGGPAPVVTSAGALVDGLHVIGARRIVLIAPYLPALTRTVVDYLEAEGIAVLDHLALGVPGNLDVAALDQRALVDHAKALDRPDADAVVHGFAGP